MTAHKYENSLEEQSATPRAQRLACPPMWLARMRRPSSRKESKRCRRDRALSALALRCVWLGQDGAAAHAARARAVLSRRSIGVRVASKPRTKTGSGATSAIAPAFCSAFAAKAACSTWGAGWDFSCARSIRSNGTDTESSPCRCLIERRRGRWDRIEFITATSSRPDCRRANSTRSLSGIRSSICPIPARFCRKPARLLRPGGIVVIGLPNFGGYQARHFGEDWFGLSLPHHLYHYTRETLARLLEDCGFRVRVMEDRTGAENYHALKHSLLNRLTRRHGRRGGRLMYYAAKPFLHPWEWISTRVGGGSSLQVCAERVSPEQRRDFPVERCGAQHRCAQLERPRVAREVSAQPHRMRRALLKPRAASRPKS